MEISDGEFVTITGESGSGKSTLLSLLSGLDKADTGSVFYDDKDILSFDNNELSKFRNKKIGIIFQSFFLEPNYSVLENVTLPLIKVSAKEAKDKGLEVLKKVGLLDKANQKAKTLSGGEQQRCAIARAIINDPEVIFADEPCGNLDSKNSLSVMELLLQLNQAGKTVIMVSHNTQHAHMSKRIITLKDGAIVGDEVI